MGLENIEKEQFTEAINYCNQALELNPYFSIAWNNKGYALSQLKSYQEAIKALDRAIEIDNSLLSLKNKVDVLLKIDRDEEANSICDQIIEIEPDNYEIWSFKGLVLAGLDRYKDALEALERAISIESENVLSWWGKACCLASMKKSQQALECLKEAVRLDPDKVQKMIQDDLEDQDSCFDYLRNDERFQPLMESSVGIDYSKLKRLLTAKRWKEADKETARLLCLAVTLQEKRFGLLDDEDSTYTELDEEHIKHLPLNDLKTIDRLWMQHCNGKFGFSVQKKIYESFGGNQEFDGEKRDKFGDATGWRIRDTDGNYSWRSSKNFIYNFQQAPKGHLPSCLWAGVNDGWFENRRDRFIVLIYHLDSLSKQRN